MRYRLAFTLIELAIVVTVIAFLAGGIIAARSIVRTSQLQSVMSEYQMYNAAIKNFQSKYRALPGDFSTATTLWDTRTICPVDATASSGTQTCNGDGDGFIRINSTLYEHLLAWRHLGLSGFISQNYTGNTASGTISCPIDIKGGDNVPSSRLKAASWNLGANTYTASNYTGGAANTYFPMSTTIDQPTVHALWLGGSLQDDDLQAASCALSQIPVMTGAEAFELDAKYDDASGTTAGSFTGKIRGQYNNTNTYTASGTCELTTSTSGAYRTSATGMNCSLVFLLEP